MTAATTRKTSLENKHLRRCDFFAIIPLRSHSTMLVKYAKTRLVLIHGVVVPVVDAKAPCASGTWKYHVFYEGENKKNEYEWQLATDKRPWKKASSEVNPQLFFQFN